MMSLQDPLRRKVVAAIASLPLIATGAGLGGQGSSASKTKVLVAYFSRSGNTKVIAGLIQRSQNGDLFEIRPAAAYPDDYLETVEQARRETAAEFKSGLDQTVADMERYEVVFLGFPIWGQTAPPVIKTFLSEHALAGKTVVPFITHGGYGLGNSLGVIADHAPGAHLLEGFVMEGQQERKTMEQVNGWLSRLA
ncbi:flavodoxin [Pseudomonas marginalis ICMP 9505]|nr:flavodoxin [Pseudomonas marginalis ICMP 9505]